MNKKILISAFLLVSLCVGGYVFADTYSDNTSFRNNFSDKTVNITEKDNKLIEIFDPEDSITIPNNSAYFKFKKDILNGQPMKYYSFEYDNKTFEWLTPKNKDEISFKENAVLLITYNNKTQIIKVKGEGGQGTYVEPNDKFSFVDVNFDGNPDLMVKAGTFGNQEAAKYYCFIQTNKGFKEVPKFVDILNPVIDKENKVIKSEWRNSANSYGKAEYKISNNKILKIK